MTVFLLLRVLCHIVKGKRKIVAKPDGERKAPRPLPLVGIFSAVSSFLVISEMEKGMIAAEYVTASCF